MRRLLGICITIMAILAICLVNNVVYLADSNNQHEEIIRKLKEYDKLKFCIKYKFNINNIIGHQEGADIAEVTGEFGSLDGIMSIMGKGFSVDAALIEIGKIGLYVLGTKIGVILADGEQTFSINDRSIFEFINDDKEKKLVKIIITGDTTGTKRAFHYKLELISNQWIITDEADEEDTYQNGDNWTIIRASSILSGKNIPYRKYSAGNVIDNNLSTAWVEGKSDDGISEWLDFSFYREINISSICVINGYAKSQELYQANNRVKRIKIMVDGNELLTGDFIDGDLNYQSIVLPKKIITERIRLIILDIFPGKKYHDTCVSEVKFQ